MATVQLETPRNAARVISLRDLVLRGIAVEGLRGIGRQVTLERALV